MGPFKKYVTCIMTIFTLTKKLLNEEKDHFFAHMAASAYDVISTEVENHIFERNWIFRHLSIYNQPTLTK